MITALSSATEGQDGDPDKLAFGYVTIEQAEDLERHHPLVARALETGSRHGPTHLPSLRTCPDSYPDFPCFFYVATPERLVASLRAIPDRLHARGRVYLWAWCCDLFTDPEMRGKGLAKLVVKGSVPALHGRDIAWGGLFASPVTNHICLQLGFQIPGFGPRLMLMKSIRPFATHVLKSPFTGHVADLIYRAAYGAVLSPILHLRLARRDRYRIQTFEDTVALQRNTLPPQIYDGDFHFSDELEKLAWKLGHTRNVSVSVVYDAQTDRPLCHLAFKTRFSEQTFLQQFGHFKLMTLMDFGVFGEPRHYRTAIQTAVRHFLDSDADMLEVISTSGTLNREATKLGFLRIGKGTPLIFHFPPKWDFGPEVFNPMKWRLTHFSGDGFAFR